MVAFQAVLIKGLESSQFAFLHGELCILSFQSDISKLDLENI